MSEKEWVSGLKSKIDKALNADNANDKEWKVYVDQRCELAYAHEVFRYNEADEAIHQSCDYQTDLLVYDWREDGDWIPRVIVECKLGISTHDVLIYNAKAATHKQVHPYLRYGLLIGGFDVRLPARAIRHGPYFDFMMYWASPDETPDEWDELLRVLRAEIQASRTLEGLLGKGKSKGEMNVWMLHRQLIVK